MIVESLESYYFRRSIAAAKKTQRWNRVSSLGRCPRELAYKKLGVEPEPMQARRWSVLEDGDVYDISIKRDILQAMGDRAVEYTGAPILFELEGVEITGSPDFTFQTLDGRLALGEIKSMSNFGFERALAGQIEFPYLAQGWGYHYGTSFDPIVFVCVRKETRHICEVVFDSQANETVVTRRYGGDPLELAREDPMLVAEIRSPFDAEIEKRVRETVRSVANCNSLSTLPAGVSAIEPEIVKIQSKEGKKQAEDKYGAPVQIAGSWATFATGRQVLGFPCSYCGFKANCFPGAKLELDGERPKWVVEVFK